MELRTEVLIIGGGATGAGIARDLALRGIPCLLLEKGDFASGASGRNHGLLHSGGRYVVSDPEAARECIQENQDPQTNRPSLPGGNGSLFVSLPKMALIFRTDFSAPANRESGSRLSRDEALGIGTRP
jgi:glycerol-3-phosphate dehydrogenase